MSLTLIEPYATPGGPTVHSYSLVRGPVSLCQVQRHLPPLDMKSIFFALTLSHKQLAISEPWSVLIAPPPSHGTALGTVWAHSFLCSLPTCSGLFPENGGFCGFISWTAPWGPA